jgi:hypothetical protein
MHHSPVQRADCEKNFRWSLSSNGWRGQNSCEPRQICCRYQYCFGVDLQQVEIFFKPTDARFYRQPSYDPQAVGKVHDTMQVCGTGISHALIPTRVWRTRTSSWVTALTSAQPSA